jgi:hypothetical protein
VWWCRVIVLEVEDVPDRRRASRDRRSSSPTTHRFPSTTGGAPADTGAVGVLEFVDEDMLELLRQLGPDPIFFAQQERLRIRSPKSTPFCDSMRS